MFAKQCDTKHAIILLYKRIIAIKCPTNLKHVYRDVIQALNCEADPCFFYLPISLGYDGLNLIILRFSNAIRAEIVLMQFQLDWYLLLSHVD